MAIGNVEQRKMDTSKKEIGVGCCYAGVAYGRTEVGQNIAWNS